MSDTSLHRDALRRHREIDDLSREGLVYVWVIGLVITGLFGWVLLKHVPFIEGVFYLKHEYLQPLLLAFYYYCWVAGTKFDLTTQKWVYLSDPSKKRFPISSVLVVACLCGIAVLLFWVKDNDKLFASTFGGLVATNVIAWLHILSRVLPIIRLSAKMYKSSDEYFGIERLYIVAYYINGRWQWWRFFGMFLIVACMIIVSFIPSLRETLTSLIQSRVSSGTIPSSVISDLLLFLFIGFAESWIWLERLRTRFSMRVIDNLDDNYRLITLPEAVRALEARSKIFDNLSWRAMRKSATIFSSHRKRPRRRRSAGAQESDK